MPFELVSAITEVVTIAAGRSIRDLAPLRRRHGPGRCRKCKGVVAVRLSGGHVRRAELHWYEAHYERLPDKVGTREGYVRVVDESGEDYLYPEGYFVAVEVPRQAERAFARRVRMRASNAPMQRPALARRR